MRSLLKDHSMNYPIMRDFRGHLPVPAARAVQVSNA